tara:strand:+ start:234 stop:398 length:165 start_codon:yes stop_codon:yes gene_type:complete
MVTSTTIVPRLKVMHPKKDIGEAAEPIKKRFKRPEKQYFRAPELQKYKQIVIKD